jgi:ATP-dependent DNA helicase RecQ
MRRFGAPTYRYHGKMTATERDTEQRRFMRPRHRSIMVATNAFGLGIDKRDIRYILHFQAPTSLEQYVQEAGRAGRDGRKANCILLADPADRSIHEALLLRSRVRPDQLYRLGRALAAWAGEGRSPTLEALAVSAELGPRVVAALLVKLEEGGLVERAEDEIRIVVPADEIKERARGLAGQFETIRIQDNRRLDALGEYARTTDCRATFLRAYFGETEDDPCNLCDNCQERKPRSAGFFAPLAAKKKEPRRRRRPRKPKAKSGTEQGKKPRRRRRRKPRKPGPG